jgi:selenocysteine-specific elongation factor
VLLDTAQLEPGQSALAQLRFDLPVVALPGDCFILRGFLKQENYGTTVGGGVVLRVLSRKVRPRDQAAVALIQQATTAAPSERLALEVLAADSTGLTRLQLQQRLPFVPQELERLVNGLLEKQQLIRFDKEQGSVIHRESFERLLDRLRYWVDQFHLEHPLEAGISREELRSRLGARLDPRLFFALLQQLEKTRELVLERDLCHRTGHTVQLASVPLRPLADSLEIIFARAALGPPRESELLSQLSVAPNVLADALKLLLEEEKLQRISNLYFSRQAVNTLRTRLVTFLEKEGQISAAQFKELVGQSRKFSIPLAEYFDAQKVTLRIGDLRKLRR